MNATDVIWVAHRGDAAHYLENTLAAFSGAALLGLTHVEMDVQVTADDVPLVLHDPSLARTHGLDLDVRLHTLEGLARHGIFDARKFDYPVPRLEDFAGWMQSSPGMHAFVEIKKESLRTRGRRRVLEAVTGTLERVRDRCTLISYDARVLSMAKRRGHAVGYVLPGMGRRHALVAKRLAPELLLADYRQIVNAGGVWPGAWDWAAFEVEDEAIAHRLLDLGVLYLETMMPSAMLDAVALSATHGNSTRP